MRQRRLQIACIYLAGLLQGSAFVLIPALGNTFAAAPYRFGSAEYALLFLPQTAGAIVGAAAAGWLQRRLGMGRLFRWGLSANLLALLLLSSAAFAGGGPLSYALILVETLLLGVGFGWTLAAINHYSEYFFSRSASAAITLLNAVIGGATALSPLVLSAVQSRWSWAVWPLALAAGFVVAWLPRLPETGDDTGSVFWPRGVLPFVLVVLVYAICEGSFGSWASVYLSVDKHLGAHAGTLALSTFWGSMTLFRVLLAPLPQRWISRRGLLFLSAAGMASCVAALPWLSGPWALVGMFALAGAACSIFYPFVMSAGLERFARHRTQVAGLIVAALMVGEGLGSYGPGLLQPGLRLEQIYLLSALWGVPLAIGAWLVSRTRSMV